MTDITELLIERINQLTERVGKLEKLPWRSGAASVDALAAAGSLRTLGTGAQQAAAGNHNHAMSWLSFTPIWKTYSDPQPVLGNGTLYGEYAPLGNTYLVKVTLTIGSTTTFGTGGMYFILPWSSVGLRTLGVANISDSSAAARLFVMAVGSGASVQLSKYDGSGLVTGTVPVALASGDSIEITFPIRVA